MDPFSQVELIGRVVSAIASWKLANTIRDFTVNFIGEIANSLGKAELTNWIVRLRSDAALVKQIESATERAAQRWANDYSDRELVEAIAEDTTFIDLPAIRAAIQAIARNPFNPVPTEILSAKFAQVLPPRFDMRRVEDGIGVFLEYLRQEFVGISELREVLHVFAEMETAHALRQTEQMATALAHIEAILEHGEFSPKPTADTLKDYLNWASKQYVSLYPPGTLQPVRQIQVRLDAMYVPLEVQMVQPMDVIARSIMQSERASSRLHRNVNEGLPGYGINNTTWEESLKSDSPLLLPDLLGKYNKFVILGDPGAGKTTHLRYLLLKFAQAILTASSQGADSSKLRLPLYLRLANFAENHRGQSLYDFLIQTACNDSFFAPALMEIVRERLAQGTCLVLLDGIDEVIELSKRAELAHQIDQLIRTYEDRGNQFIITARLEGYHFTPISGEIPHFRIRDLNDHQMHCLLERWCQTVERFESPALTPEKLETQVQKQIAQIDQAIRVTPGVRKLVSNPLHLNTVALIHRMGARLPQRRIELYRSVVDILMRSWQLARGMPESALVREANANRLLAELAAWIHETRPNGLVSEGEVKDKLAALVGSMQGQQPDHPDVLTTVDEFLLRIRQYTGLFVEGPSRHYSFIHSTIQEYFAARWLVSRPSGAARRIRKYIHRPHWVEPILLAVGYMGMEFPAGVSELIEQAILGKDLGGPSPYEAILKRDLIFALRCLGDQDADHELRCKVVAATIQSVTNADGGVQYELRQKRLLQTIQVIQGSPVAQDLEEGLLNALHDANAEIRKHAAHALSKTTLSSQSVSALLTAMIDENATVRESAAFALCTATFSEEAVTTLLAELNDEIGVVRASAASALGNATLPPDAVTHLLQAMRDKNSLVRTKAAEALSHATMADESVDILLAALHDKNSKIRAIAADALKDKVSFPEALEALLVALRDKNSQVRASAAEALQNTRLSLEATTALLDALKDKNSRVRQSATEALRGANLSTEVTTALLSALRDSDSKVRKSATEALRNGTLTADSRLALLTAMKDDNAHIRATSALAFRHTTLDVEAATALMLALNDENRNVRESASASLSNATLAAEAVPVLISALHDEREYVRVCVIDALRNVTAQPNVIPALLDALNDKNGRVCINAANALSKADLSKNDVATLVVAVSSAPTSKVRAAACVALSGSLSLSEVIVALLVALRDKNINVRANAARALGNAPGSETIVKALLATLDDSHTQVRVNVITAFKGFLDYPEVIVALLSRLDDQDALVRASVADVLADLTNRTEVVNALLEMLEDSDEHVRVCAADALRNASLHAGAVTVLLAALCERDERLRASAATALSNATLSVKAITALLHAVHDENESVRVSAANALAHIVLQSEAQQLSDLPEQIANTLNQSDIDNITGFWMRHPRHSLFEALDAVAPGPNISD